MDYKGRECFVCIYFYTPLFEKRWVVEYSVLYGKIV